MTTSYAVRVLSRDGQYPSTPLIIDNVGVLAADGVVWSAVRLSDVGVKYSVTSNRLGAPSGEISWLLPEEIRFFAAVSLAEAHPRRSGRVRIVTRDLSRELELEEPITPALLLERSRGVALETFRRLEQLRDEDSYVLNEPDSGCPAERLRRDYTARTRKLLERMDVNDALLHRGLYKFLMATELRRHPKFLEESMLAALISREAALELLRRKLSAAAGQRLRYEDVLYHIADTFPTGEPFAGVLESDWDARLAIAHPVSIHGEHWSPPVEAGECMEALHSLTYLYRYLLLDEVWKPGKYD